MAEEITRTLVDRYGPDLSCWPEAALDELQRAGGEAALMEALAEARALDDLLDLARDTIGPSVALQEAILRQAPIAAAGPRHGSAFWSGWLPRLSGAMALAACMAVGLVVGQGLALENLEQQQAEAQLYAVYAEEPGAWWEGLE